MKRASAPRERDRRRPPAPSEAPPPAAQPTLTAAGNAPLQRAARERRWPERAVLARQPLSNLLTGAGHVPPDLSYLVLSNRSAREVFQLMSTSKSVRQQVRAALAQRLRGLEVNTDATWLSGRLRDLPYLRDLNIDFVIRALVRPEAQHLPLGRGPLTQWDVEVLLDLMQDIPPGGRLTMEDATNALAMPLDVELSDQSFWEAVVARRAPTQQATGGRPKRRASQIKPKTVDDLREEKRARRRARQEQRLNRVDVTGEVQRLELLALCLHNGITPQEAIMWYEGGGFFDASVDPVKLGIRAAIDTQGTTTVARIGGQYYVARQNREPPVHGLAMLCTQLGLPQPTGPPIGVSAPMLDLHGVATSGVHGETYIIRWLWLNFLHHRGIDDDRLAPHALYVRFLRQYQAWGMLMGSSQPACWDCAGFAAVLGAEHGATGSAPSDMWVHPFTRETFASEHNPQGSDLTTMKKKQGKGPPEKKQKK